MSTSDENSPFQRWHSNDFLIRIECGESPDDESTPLPDATPVVVDPFNARSPSPFDLKFDAPSLVTASADPDLHEHLSVLRSTRLSTPHLINFAARNKSVWALDVLAGRLTGNRRDWASMRATVLNFSRAPRDFEPTLDRVKLEDLYSLCELLHERAFDPEAERALLLFIAVRVIGGRELGAVDLEAFIESLLMTGVGEEAAVLFPRLSEESWLRYAIAAELEHPRFAGSFEAMLVRLNEAYYQFGLERLSIDGPGKTPFERLDATALAHVQAGPLVTVVMTAQRPGTELETAVRSIVGQTYQDWELIVIDDGSPEEYSPVLDEVAALDPRIRVIRNDTNLGTYVRRNEAIQLAHGEFVTMQDSSGWSHPRRMELQVRDLLAVPARLANIVRGARVSDDFSLFTALGAGLTLVESSILFRREAVVRAVGYFDSTWEDADVEFRKRLEAATGTPVRAVASEIPLEFVRVELQLPIWGKVGKSIWTEPELMAYRSSSHRFHERIRGGRCAPQLAFPQGQRIIAAPPRLLGIEGSAQRVDLLVVVDGQQPPWRTEFIDAVVQELRTAVSAGLRVALLHSESVTGVRNIGPLGKDLQLLIDSGQVLQIFDSDPVEATAVVVRHAGAAQGHFARRRPITTSRVVVVEDPAGGDLRGETVAKADVLATVTSWFGVEPSWIVARPTPPRPTITSVVVDGGTVSVRLEAPDLASISAVRIGNGRAFLDLEASIGEDAGGEFLLAAGAVSELQTGDLSVAVARQIDGDQPALQTCFVPPSSVLTGPGECLLVSSGESGGLRMLPPASDPDVTGAFKFFRQYLAAEVSLARAFRDQYEVTVTGENLDGLTALYALRSVNGQLQRREFTLEAPADGRRRARHKLPRIVNVRWQIYGLFQTPLGAVQVPVGITDATVVQGSDEFRVRKLTGDGVLQVLPRQVTAAPRKDPELSVVMPVYNVEPYLDTAIRSVLTQDFENLELIIIDDASSDNGRRIIEMHRELDPRVRVIELDHNTLGGAGVPSNLGIRAARGKYIGFVDSDDWVSKTGLKRLVTLAKQHNAEVAIGDFQLFNDDDRQLTSPPDTAAWLDIPTGEVISAFTHPSLLRLSPVPWRKIYRRDFVEANRIRFPEGDFFYEDNALHWLVLSRAHRIVASDEVVSYHRMEREGQTMGAELYKFAAIASHANTIVNALVETHDENRDALFQSFIDYLRRQNWTVRRQTQPAAVALLQRRFAAVYEKAITAAPAAPVQQEVRRHFEAFRGAYPDLDLTIVIPVFNSADYIRETLDSVLKLRGLSYNVLLVDDGSTDSSLKIILEYEKAHHHVHVFTQKNRGAGRARNSVIPLVTGRYTYFLDADDLVDAGALVRAVVHADKGAADLLFVKYRLDYVDEKRSRGMFDADVEIWNQLSETAANDERQRLVAGLINYPWNRLIRSSVLHDANIFFGPTVVHNDMLFHWHSILSVTNIGFLDAEVCAHRKFKTRVQVTNIVDERRMAVLEALRGTHERISELESYPNVREEWQRFAVHLVEWAKDRIPATLQEVYEERSQQLIQMIFGVVPDRSVRTGGRESRSANSDSRLMKSAMPLVRRVYDIAPGLRPAGRRLKLMLPTALTQENEGGRGDP